MYDWNTANSDGSRGTNWFYGRSVEGRNSLCKGRVLQGQEKVMQDQEVLASCGLEKGAEMGWVFAENGYAKAQKR